MPLTVYRRGQIWHYRGSVAGRRLRGSTKTADKKIAQRITSAVEARHWKGALDGPEAVLTFANAAHLYLNAKKPDRFLAKLSAYWKDTLVKAINPGAIRQACIDLLPNAAGSTRNRHVIVPTQAIINHAASRALCQPIRVPRWPVEHHEKTPATWEWIEAFRAVAPPHLGALALFMFCTGARISEALAVTWDDVDFSRRNVLIRQTKIGAERLAHNSMTLKRLALPRTTLNGPGPFARNGGKGQAPPRCRAGSRSIEQVQVANATYRLAHYRHTTFSVRPANRSAA